MLISAAGGRLGDQCCNYPRRIEISTRITVFITAFCGPPGLRRLKLAGAVHGLPISCPLLVTKPDSAIASRSYTDCFNCLFFLPFSFDRNFRLDLRPASARILRAIRECDSWGVGTHRTG
jgi:hypothetical protein